MDFVVFIADSKRKQVVQHRFQSNMVRILMELYIVLSLSLT